MDFERLKRGMADIVEIVESVPDPFRERCFDALLTALLNETAPPVAPKAEPQMQKPAAPAALAAEPIGVEAEQAPKNGAVPIKGQMNLFMRRTGVSEETLAKVVSYIDDHVEFIHEPKPATTAAGQIEWTLLSALESAIMHNSFSVDGEAIRKLCDEKGYLDGSNFWANFKRREGYFSKPITAADPKQTLSTEGQAALAKLIESLAIR